MAEEGFAARLLRCREMLKTAETRVSTADGKQFTERLSADGSYCTSTNKDAVCSLPLGFIQDLHPDLGVGVIYDNLIFGSQDVAADKSLLTQYGVTHVLNVARCVPNRHSHELVYKNMDLLDLPEAPLAAEELIDACDFIDAGRSVGCVLVHCNAGVSRSAAVVIAYLMRSRKWTYSEAYEYVKLKRPRARPNRGFATQLTLLEQRLWQ